MSKTEKDMEYRNGRMGRNMRDSGVMTKQMGKGNFTMQMGMFMMESGKMTKRMDMVYICMLMGPDTKVNGRKISNSDMGKNHGQIMLNMKGIIVMGRSMEKGY